MSENLIEFNNISKFFGKVIALKDVTMKLRKGEIMCLLGDNGAGKSTLIKTLAGVHIPDEGEIVIEGKKTVFESPKDALDMGIGTVYQDLALAGNLPIGDNIFLGREPVKKVGPFNFLDHKKRKQLTEEHLAKLKINVKSADQKVEELSGGQKQRVAIARALVTQPKIVLADEPTGALDSNTSSSIMTLLKEIHNDGMTVVVITHEEDIAAQTERIVRLKDGVITSDEKTAQPKITT